MARKLTGFAILTLVLGLTSIGLGQAPEPNGYVGVGSMLFAPSIQKELKLGEKQVDKLKDGLGKVMAKYKPVFAKYQKSPPSPEESEKTMKGFHDDSLQTIAGVLDAKQMKRFKQLFWQSMGASAVFDPEVEKQLKISAEQKKKISAAFEDGHKKAKALAEKRQLSEQKYLDLMKEVEKNALAVLSDEQRKTFGELKGPKFEFPRAVLPTTEKR